MSIAVGAHASVSNTGGTTPTTPTRTTAASGSTFVLFVVCTGTLTSVHDSKLNTYTQIGSTLNSQSVWICVNGTGGAAHTATAIYTGTAFVSIFFVEVTGGLTSGILDQSPAGNQDAASPYTSLVTGTTAQANELLLAFVGTNSNSGTEVLTWGNSFAAIDAESSASTGTTGGSASRVVSATGTYSSSVTSTGAGTTDATSWIISLNDATPGGGSVTVETPTRRLLSGMLPHLRM